MRYYVFSWRLITAEVRNSGMNFDPTALRSHVPMRATKTSNVVAGSRSQWPCTAATSQNTADIARRKGLKTETHQSVGSDPTSVCVKPGPALCKKGANRLLPAG